MSNYVAVVVLSLSFMFSLPECSTATPMVRTIVISGLVGGNVIDHESEHRCSHEGSYANYPRQREYHTQTQAT